MPTLELMPGIDGFEARQKMPRGPGRNNRNFENIADRRNRTLFRRSSVHNDYKLFPKEPQLSVLVLRNSEQRCIVFTLVALELDAYCKLATFLPSLQAPEWRNHLGSGAHSEVGGHESMPPPAIIFPGQLQKEQSINLPEGTSSSKSSSACSTSGTQLLCQTRKRNKRTKSVKSCSIRLPSCSILDNSSGSLCDSLSAIGSDGLASDVPGVDKPVKKSSRKKGKKKRKQYKESTQNIVSTEVDRRCEESICGTSVVETSINGNPACFDERLSQNHLSYKATLNTLSGKDISREKDDSENNNDYTDSSTTTLVSCISFNNEMDDCEPVASLAEGFFDGEFSCNNITDPNSTLRTKQLPEKIQSCLSVNDKSSNISLDQYPDAPMLDSFQHGWNFGISKNCRGDVERRLSLKEEGGINFSGGMILDSTYYDSSFHRTMVSSCVTDSVVSDDSHINCSYRSKDVDTHRITDGSNCSSQACSSSQTCSSSNFLPVISGRRGRMSRKLSVRTGKDNNHPVWQKVQKTDAKHCICEPINLDSSNISVSKNDSGTRARVDTLPELRQNQRGKTGRYSSSHEMISQTSKTCSLSVASTVVDSTEIISKRKPSPASKQPDRYSRKGSHNCNSEIAKTSKIHVHQKEGSKFLPQSIHNKHESTGLNPPCSIDSPELMVKPSERIDFCQREQQQKTRELTDEATSLGDVCSTMCEMTSTTAYNQIGPLPTALDSLHHPNVIVHSDRSDAGYYEDRHEVARGKDDPCRKSQTETSHVECSKPDNSFGPVLQKWVPVGRKDPVVSNTSRIDNLTASVVHKAVPRKLDIKNAEVVVSSECGVQFKSDAHFLPSTGDHSHCLNSEVNKFTNKSGSHPHTAGQFHLLPGSTTVNEGIDCSSTEIDKLTGKVRSHPCKDEEFVGLLAASTCQSTHEVKDQGYSGFESELDKIIKAVDDAHKLQTAEGIDFVSGSCVADFEIFIHSASPVICQRYNYRNCNTCSPEQPTSNSLCLHQIPNISLRSLWQWYEEPGCYGLQVKVEDHSKSKRLHNGFFECSAYFVPYLSSVQLFGRSGMNNVNSNGEVLLSSEVDKTSKSSSCLGSLPIFSMLLPQPRKEVDAFSLESSSFANNEIFNPSARGTNLRDGELIFEYFEYDQPPQRRPLFEKIKELVRGEVSSNCKVYGDPLKLEFLNLHDLHPASWYSVAWYPIYRIPEGNFRAAFLTYHSLGHFIQRSSSSSFTHIASPVVGLQSYNAKRECWFQLRGSQSKVVQTEVASCSRPEILEKRMNTLEHTASMMSTASVCKGNQRSDNKHPDYSYFFSRW